MSAHTPGPWRAAYDGHGGMSVECDEGQIGFVSNRRSQEANARLIAAAPELLEAAKRIEKRIAYYASMAEAGQPNIEQWAYTDQSGDVKALRDAIAKAEVQS